MYKESMKKWKKALSVEYYNQFTLWPDINRIFYNINNFAIISRIVSLKLHYRWIFRCQNFNMRCSIYQFEQLRKDGRLVFRHCMIWWKIICQKKMSVLLQFGMTSSRKHGFLDINEWYFVLFLWPEMYLSFYTYSKSEILNKNVWKSEWVLRVKDSVREEESFPM